MKMTDSHDGICSPQRDLRIYSNDDRLAKIRRDHGVAVAFSGDGEKPSAAPLRPLARSCGALILPEAVLLLTVDEKPVMPIPLVSC